MTLYFLMNDGEIVKNKDLKNYTEIETYVEKNKNIVKTLQYLKVTENWLVHGRDGKIVRINDGLQLCL